MTGMSDFIGEWAYWLLRVAEEGIFTLFLVLTVMAVLLAVVFVPVWALLSLLGVL